MCLVPEISGRGVNITDVSGRSVCYNPMHECRGTGEYEVVIGEVPGFDDAGEAREMYMVVSGQWPVGSKACVYSFFWKPVSQLRFVIQ